jgi:hypothetical protein
MAIGGNADGPVDVSKDIQLEGLQNILERCLKDASS